MQPVFAPVGDIPLANYEIEQQAFADLLEPDCPQRILMFKGESGKGKTHLLQACLKGISGNDLSVRFDFKESSVGIAEIFSRIGSVTGWKCWSHFSRQVASLNRTPRIRIDRNWLIGMDNHINVVLKVENPADREQRSVDLTEAWHKDSLALNRPLLIVLDTYEQALPEVAGWINGPFLERAARTHMLRVVVAGQKVPEPNNIEWGHCCSLHDLYGVPEAKYWLPVVDALGLKVPVEPGLVYLAGICEACKGKPDEIMKVISRFPRRETELVQ